MSSFALPISAYVSNMSICLAISLSVAVNDKPRTLNGLVEIGFMGIVQQGFMSGANNN